MSGSSSKGVLLPFAVISGGNMAGNITSAPTNTQYLDNVVYVLSWPATGSPNGTFAVQVSEDYTVSSTGTVTNSGTWVPITLSATITAASVADNALIDLNQLPSSWVRIVYTRSSGTGTLTGYVSGKAV